jgi:hypothetical protein
MVCYSASPPEKSIGFLTEDVGVIRSHSDITVQTHELQEVSNVNTGNVEMVSNQILLIEQEGKLEFPKLVIINNYSNYKEEINRPPKNNFITVTILDKRHSNYSCPLTVNYCN